MVPMACVDLPAFPLQILLKRHPEWSAFPVAVIDEDRPQGRLLWVNERARAGRVLSGMRYAGALSLSRELRAAVVSSQEIEAEIAVVLGRLRFFSPEVEPAREDPGTFWLGAEGLGLLHPTFTLWTEMMRADLAGAGFEGRVAVGFSRFGTYAAARSMGHGEGASVRVFRDPEEESAAVRRIPIDRIACDPEFRDTLARLGIFELGGFLDLPPAGVRRRFGDEAHALHRRARGDWWAPLDPEIPEEPHERRIVLDSPETDTDRLLQAIEGELGALLGRLRARDRALTSLHVEIGFDRPGPEGERRRLESLRPASPTRDPRLLLDLLRLRLESMSFPSGAVDVRLEVEFLPAGAEQMSLFPEPSRRDLEAANRALARVRAEFGEESVCAARMRDAHLPEARFALEPMRRLDRAQPRAVRLPGLVRRILHRPTPIALTGPPLAGMKISGAGVIREASGPFVVSGGWWRGPVARRYWYVLARPEAATSDAAGAATGDASGAATADGAWLWIYHDDRRGRWYRQGGVE